MRTGTRTYSPIRRAYGLGATSGAQLGLSIGTVAAQGGSAAVLTSSAGAGISAALGGAAIAVPVIGAAIAGIAIGIEAILNSGCGQTCIETSQWANQAEPLLQQNVEAYFAIGAPRPMSVQSAAVQNFANVWNRLVQLCSQSGLGTAGKNCIADRQSGACKWKASSTGAYPGQPAQGQCWNWWNAYHDPIANDTQVYNDSAGGSLSTISGTTTGGGPLISTGIAGEGGLLVIGGAILGVILLVTLL